MEEYICAGCSKAIDNVDEGIYLPDLEVYLHAGRSLTESEGRVSIEDGLYVSGENKCIAAYYERERKVIKAKSTPLSQLEEAAQREVLEE